MQINLKCLYLSSGLVAICQILLACSAFKPVATQNVDEQAVQEEAMMTRDGVVKCVTDTDNSGQVQTDAHLSVEGKITQVLPSSPGQVMLENYQGMYAVNLLSDTKITQAGKMVDFRQLSPGVWVKIQGLPVLGSQLVMSAQAIEIQSPGKI